CPLHQVHPSLRGRGARRSLGLLLLVAVLQSSQILKPLLPMPLTEDLLLYLRPPPPPLSLTPPFSRDKHPYHLSEQAATPPPPCLRSQLRSWLVPLPLPATFSTSLSRLPWRLVRENSTLPLRPLSSVGCL